MSVSSRRLPAPWRHDASIDLVHDWRYELVLSYLYSESLAPISTSQTHTIFDVVIDYKVEFFIRKPVMSSENTVDLVYDQFTLPWLKCLNCANAIFFIIVYYELGIRFVVDHQFATQG